jgi:sucrose phosphorylase
MPVNQGLRDRLFPKLKHLYGLRAEDCLQNILERVDAARPNLPLPREPLWSEQDVVLITYGDQVRDGKDVPLIALDRFLTENGLNKVLNTIHLLPCFPYSSDDGFSVIDYRQIDPALGDWNDVERLRTRYSLMFDLVLNHVSRHSRWFEDYVAGREPYTRFFIEVNSAADTSSVTRPRSLPLFTRVDTSRGPRHVWTTFSDDQIDLNYAEPDVLAEMIDVLLLYLCRGGRIIRLDAIAYLWKRLGTPCIHLAETHVVVKILRDIVEVLAPGAILLTETNVPHEENISYFGDGDEARMVYQFSLAPLLLEALLTGDATLLTAWLADQEPTPPGTTMFNFTASHDGIGVRPLEGIMPPERFNRLLEAIGDRGGSVSTKRNPDGTHSPYELNVTYFSALDEPGSPDHEEIQVARFLASQAIMLSLRGIPGVYFHSLVATPNDVDGWARTGRARSINRRKYTAAELCDILGQTEAPPSRILDAYHQMLATRIAQPAFHPEADQQLVSLESPSLLGLLRTSRDGGQRIVILANLSATAQQVAVSAIGRRSTRDLLADGTPLPADNQFTLAPYQVSWLELG